MITTALLKAKMKWWFPLVILLLLNLLVFLGVRFLFSGTLREAWTARSNLQREVKKLEVKNAALQAKLKGITDAVKTRNAFYARLGTKDENLTKILTDVEDLTRQAGLIPHSWGFGEKEMTKQAPLLLFSISLPLEGSYADIRKLLHFLELSDTFVVVNGIALREAGEMQQNVSLSMKMETYFYAPALPETSTTQKRKR